MIIKNANVFCDNYLFSKKDIYIEGELISTSCNDETIVDASDLYAIPGLIDIHIHGSVGHDFCDGTQEAICAMADYLAKNGVTSFVPASMTLSEEQLTQIYSNAGKYTGEKGSMLLGINMEGPFICSEKKGAQNGKYIKEPDINMFNNLNSISNNKIKLVSIAPEVNNALEFISAIKDNVAVSIAHTNSNYDIAKHAFEIGAKHVTHLYNAMPPLSHRSPGVIGASADSNCTVELICDGVHIHESVVRATYKLFTDERVVLVSDSMMAAGMSDGTYELGGQPVTVKGNKATLSDGTVAGSVTNLMKCMLKAIEFGIPIESAIKSATANPAKVIGEFDKIGSITSGKYANIVLLDKNFNIKSVFIKGKQYI